MTLLRQEKRMPNSFPDSALSMPFVRRFAIVTQQTSRKSSDYPNIGK